MLLRAGPGLQILLGITTRRHHHLRGQQLGRCQRGLLGSAGATAACLLLHHSPASALTSAPWPMSLSLYPSNHFYCLYFPHYKGSSFKPSKTRGLSQSLPCKRPPTAQKEGNDRSQHVPVAANAVKSCWHGEVWGVGSQDADVLPGA